MVENLKAKVQISEKSSLKKGKIIAAEQLLQWFTVSFARQSLNCDGITELGFTPLARKLRQKMLRVYYTFFYQI